jgi:hypothetical protein
MVNLEWILSHSKSDGYSHLLRHERHTACRRAEYRCIPVASDLSKATVGSSAKSTSTHSGGGNVPKAPFTFSLSASAIALSALAGHAERCVRYHLPSMIGVGISWGMTSLENRLLRWR